MKKANVHVHLPFSSSEKPSIRGFLDYIDPQVGIAGWILDTERPSEYLEVKVVVNGKVVGSVEHGLARNDVIDSIGVDANVGFALSWSSISHYLENDIGPNAGLELYLPSTNETLISTIIQTPKQLRDLTERNLLSEFAANDESDAPKVIAFYLPQYHPIPENDLWWGEGFTEWQNVARGTPKFPGHYQPHIPSQLGFYDLRVAETRKKQADLARRYGVHGFCYYYYWFAGKKLLDLPLNEMLRSREPDFPFCICWANETWSRRWDGSENEILIRQEHNEENDERFINEVIPILRDPRYIKVGGAPILLVYRVSLFPNATKTADSWRRICRENGFEVHLCAAESFSISDPAMYGFDSSVEFPPHNNVTHGINDQIVGLDPEFKGGIFDYAEFVGRDLRQPAPSYTRFKGVMLGWDNTARRGQSANLFVNSSPEMYEVWLNGAIEHTRQNLPENQQIIFVNAWNEWAEGTHLEPDQKSGVKFLEATLRAVNGTSSWSSYARSISMLNPDADSPTALIRRANAEILVRDRVITHLSKLIPSQGGLRTVAILSETSKTLVSRPVRMLKGFSGNIDRFASRGFTSSAIVDPNLGLHYISGWFVVPNFQCAEDSPFWLTLNSTNITTEASEFSALVTRRTLRTDVSALEMFRSLGSEVTDWSGFSAYLDFKRVPNGTYNIGALANFNDELVHVGFDGTLVVVLNEEIDANKTG